MTKPFDATSKDLIESAPADWVAFFGRTVDPARVTVIDADVSAVTAAADKVIRVADDPPWLLHLEFQASAEAGLPRRLLRYNALLQERHGCAVATAAVLLRKEANAADVTGAWRVAPPVGPAWSFGYEVVRVWQLPVEPLLTGGLGLLPYAPVARVQAGELPGVIGRMEARLAKVPRPLKARLWAATYILMGLKYERAAISALLQGVLQMKESVTYQAILQEGKAEERPEEARRFLVRIATKRFGPPPARVLTALNKIADPERLEALGERVLDVASWAELMAAN